MLLKRGLSPLPKCTSMNPRKRKAQSASILTSSPYKNQLIEQERKKEEKGKKIILQIHNDRESDEEEWLCIVCGDTCAEFNVKVVRGGHMTNALQVFHT